MPPLTSPALHEVAKVGFGLQVAAYEKARPGYPDEAIQHCIERLNLDHGPKAVLDLAAGTGKLTRQLAAYPNLTIQAAEPSEGMRASFKDILPDIPIVDATASTLPFESESFDAVFVGQAFHWFATREALLEIHRVLRPAGGLALLWNLEDEDKDWTKQLLQCYKGYAKGLPNYGWHTWKAVWHEPWVCDLFNVGPDPMANSCMFTFTQPYTKDQVWQRVLSLSFIATLDNAELSKVRSAVNAWLDCHAEQFKHDGPEGKFAMLDFKSEAFVVLRTRGTR
eukprot:jgi/Chrzof1/11841/Cz06g12010.t1